MIDIEQQNFSPRPWLFMASQVSLDYEETKIREKEIMIYIISRFNIQHYFYDLTVLT